ncbi:hypothetical protein HG536_0E01730 [Torulaspora globosa]|uniref:Mitochondrial ATPase complex subunit ATP10 n=1 Tax=Torulaspora globosa TaxID=48254 RepID=A0A7G3ZIC6_9SACH|nr:uncharacterized protein HG536_0E01730 [Torulaspora globosa]QLL33262.1 hypothetical protein HG536_0E01730 [Torulaspora globosa]
MAFGITPGTKRLISTTPASLFVNKFFKNVVDAAPKEHIVRELVRPIGMQTPPTSQTVYSKGNSFREMFDRDKTEKRSQELGVEFSKSGMYELHAFQKHGGKMFISPKSYWRADRALYFPHLKGTSLSGLTKDLEETLKGKTSVVRLFTNKVGDDLSKQYFQNRELDLDYLGKDLEKLATSNTQIVEVSFLENAVKSIIAKLSAYKLRSLIPPLRHANYFQCDRDQLPFTVRESLEINNIYTGYVIVVDPDLKIRWMACGAASEDEFKLLWKCVRGVRKEFAPPSQASEAL